MTEIQIIENNVTLNISVKDNLEPFTSEDNLFRFGFIEISDGYLDSETVFQDNLSYFIKINSNRKKSIKHELKEKGQYYKGVVKDVKKCIKRAKKLGLLK